MASDPKTLNKVGFSPAQAAVLQDVAGASLKQLVSAGFTTRQAKLLQTSPSFRDLLVQGKFTRPQATLLLELT